MVGIPVMLVVALAALYHTNDITPRESLTSQLGQAQAVVTTTGDQRDRLTQAPSADAWSSESPSSPPPSGTGAAATPAQAPPGRPWTMAELERVTGGRMLPLWRGRVRLGAGDAALPVFASELPLADPQTHGMVSRVSGRLPRTANEIALTPGLLHAAHWTVGSTLTDLDTGAALKVVGSYTTLGLSNGDRGVLALPGALHDPSTDDPSTRSYLLERDRPVSWAEVQSLNAQGLLVLSRAVVLHPPADAALHGEQGRLAASDPATKAVLVLIVVSLVIEVVLLAGPAFAVGVRRRRRDLALLAATGSTPRDVRRTVLAQALVVGLGSATVGALLGLPLARAAVPVIEHFGAALGPFEWHWREVLATLAVGAAAALLAALAPALQAARTDVATVLAGRRGELHSRAGWPLVGAVLIAGGAAADLTKGTRQGGEVWVAAGTVVIVLGAVALTPWLVGQVGRLATRLPLPLRLATRDAARQRSRTAPAVAAIMASVIGITALAIGFASDSKQGRRDYEPRTAYGVATVGLSDPDSRRGVLAAVNEVLPGRPVYVGNRVEDLHTDASQPTRSVVVAMPGCSFRQASGLVDGNDCGERWQRFNTMESVVAYDIPTLVAFGVPLNAQARSVLQSGGVLVAATDAITAGHASIGVVSVAGDGTTVTVERRRSLPAAPLLPATLRTARLAAVVMTPETARSLELPLVPSQLAIGGAQLSRGEQDKLQSRLTLLDTEVYVERGYQTPYRLVLTLLALVGSLVVLVATVTATALAMSEARPDLATLAAVGAPPRTRRRVAAAQAVVIGLVGTALGVVLGLVPGLAVTWPLTANSYTSFGPPPGTAGSGPVIAIPWTMLLVVVVAVPVVAGGVTASFTRSQLPMARRLAT
jgi:putative ABC transport system permease protein